MTSVNPIWYVTRGTALVALLLLTAATVLGVVTVNRWSAPSWPRFLNQSLHRNISLLAVAFIAAHVVTAVVDPFAALGAVSALVPFASSYRPVWLGLGVVAVDLLVAVTVTSLLRQRIGHRLWRAVHWLAYLSWPVALVHALGTGTDTRSFFGLLIDAACVTAVLAAVLWRVSDGWPRRSRLRTAAAGTAVAAAVGIAGFALAGPLRAGWARTAGTPVALLGGAAAPAGARAAAAPSPAPPPATLPAGLDDPLSGTVAQSEEATQVVLTDDRDPSIRLVLTVTGDEESAAATLAVSRGSTTVCTGPASVGQGITAACGATQVMVGLERSRRGVVGELVTRALGS